MASVKNDLFASETLSELYSEYYEKECPIEAFPKIIRDVAETFSRSRNLPMEYLCFCACGILSGAMGRAFSAKNAASGFTQSANLYLLGVGNSSTGKSASLRSLYAPLEKRLFKSRMQYRKDLAKWKNKQKTKLISDDGNESVSWTSETCEKGKMPRDPDFIIKNSTSEALVKAMEQSGGEIFSVCEEARDNIGIVAGNYKKHGDETEVFNSGWSLEPIKHNRITSGVSEVLSPCISVLWMVQCDAIRNIMAAKKDSFVSSGFSGRFLYFKGPTEISKGSREIIAMNETAIAAWETLLCDTYELRASQKKICLDTEPAAFEVFWNFNSANVDLMNGKLRSQSELLGKARENAIRLSIIFAIADGKNFISADIAERACKVVAYSICNSIVLFSSGMIPALDLEHSKMKAILRQSKDGYQRISYFDQQARLSADKIEFLVSTFPDKYVILKKGKGRYVTYKDKEQEVKSILKIIDDADNPF